MSLTHKSPPAFNPANEMDACKEKNTEEELVGHNHRGTISISSSKQNKPSIVGMQVVQLGKLQRILGMFQEK